MPKSNAPKTVARVLWIASPGRAVGFARAEQEKACWDFGGDRAEFWDQVLNAIEDLSDVLSRPRRTTGAVAARRTRVPLDESSSTQPRATASRRRLPGEASLSDRTIGSP